jgi:hypothetical protein
LGGNNIVKRKYNGKKNRSQRSYFNGRTMSSL